MSTWLIPNKLEDYDISKGFAKYGNEIEWTKKLQTKNIATGDTVYIYMSAPIKALTMKFVVTDRNVVVPTQTHDNDGTVIGSQWFKIGFLHDIEPIAYETLFSSGVVNGYIQSARKLKPEQERILAKYTVTRNVNSNHKTHPINVFKHAVMDGIVHPSDQPTLDKYVVYHAVAASSVRPKHGRLHVVTLNDGRKVMAQGQGQRALEAHNEKNLIKQTTNKGNVRYYVYLSETDGTEVVSVPRLYQKIVQNILSNSDEEIVEDIVSEDNGLDEIIETLQALSNDQPPERVERIISKVARNPKIAQLIKERHGYICEVCGREPFMQASGKLYAEADHIKPLGLGGLDTPENMRCLCSQCHAVITRGSDEVIKELLEPTM